MHRGESDFFRGMRARPLGIWYVAAHGSGRSAPEYFSGGYASLLFVAPRMICAWLMWLEEFPLARWGCGVWIRWPTRGLCLTVLLTLATVPGGCGRAPDSIACARRAGAVNF